MDSFKHETYLWLKYKIISRDGDLIYNHIRVPTEVYRRIARQVKITSLSAERNVEIAREIYLELIAYSIDLSLITLKFNTH